MWSGNGKIFASPKNCYFASDELESFFFHSIFFCSISFNAFLMSQYNQL